MSEATQSAESARQKKDSTAVVKRGRDGNGRFVTGNPGGPGAPPKDPTFKALAVASRQKNYAYMESVRDDVTADPWLRFEAAKFLVQYSDGKALTHQVNVQNNFGADKPPPYSGPISPADHSRAYQAMTAGLVDPLSIEFVSEEEDDAAVIDVQAQPSEADASAAPAPAGEASEPANGDAS